MATAKRAMSKDHKDALATGRNQSRAVKAYLEALKSTKPKRGRKRTADTITARLDKIAQDLASADALQEVLLLQEQANLQTELGSMGAQVDISTLEQEFVTNAAAYSAAKGIDYATWRKVGIDAAVLSKAGIKR